MSVKSVDPYLSAGTHIALASEYKEFQQELEEQMDGYMEYVIGTYVIGTSEYTHVRTVLCAEKVRIFEELNALQGQCAQYNVVAKRVSDLARHFDEIGSNLLLNSKTFQNRWEESVIKRMVDRPQAEAEERERRFIKKQEEKPWAIFLRIGGMMECAQRMPGHQSKCERDE